MAQNNVGALLVIDKGTLVGMVTLGDVVKQIISEQKFTIKELAKYISGGYEI